MLRRRASSAMIPFIMASVSHEEIAPSGSGSLAGSGVTVALVPSSSVTVTAGISTSTPLGFIWIGMLVHLLVPSAVHHDGPIRQRDLLLPTGAGIFKNTCVDP